MLLLVLAIWITVSRMRLGSLAESLLNGPYTTLGNTSTDPLTSVDTSARVTEANAKTLTSPPQRPLTQRIPSALLISRLLSWRRRIRTLPARLSTLVRLHYVPSFAQTHRPITLRRAESCLQLLEGRSVVKRKRGRSVAESHEDSDRACTVPRAGRWRARFLDPWAWPLVRQPRRFSAVRSGCRPNKPAAAESEAQSGRSLDENASSIGVRVGAGRGIGWLRDVQEGSGRRWQGATGDRGGAQAGTDVVRTGWEWAADLAHLEVADRLRRRERRRLPGPRADLAAGRWAVDLCHRWARDLAGCVERTTAGAVLRRRHGLHGRE